MCELVVGLCLSVCWLLDEKLPLHGRGAAVIYRYSFPPGQPCRIPRGRPLSFPQEYSPPRNVDPIVVKAG